MGDLFRITDVRLEECPDPKWVSKAYQCNYTLRGRKTSSEIGFSKHAVCVLLFNVTREKFVFVRQFRPSVYVAECRDAVVGSPIDVEKHPPELAVTLELCAGLVDKPGKDVRESAVEEVLEECGYEIKPEQLEHITSFVKTPPNRVGVNHLFYAEVSDDSRVGPGGGLDAEDEFIALQEMSIFEAEEYLKSENVNSPPSMLLGLMWFFQNKLRDSDEKNVK